jgi:hypothetical protein
VHFISMIMKEYSLLKGVILFAPSSSIPRNDSVHHHHRNLFPREHSHHACSGTSAVWRSWNCRQLRDSLLNGRNVCFSRIYLEERCNSTHFILPLFFHIPVFKGLLTAFARERRKRIRFVEVRSMTF